MRRWQHIGRQPKRLGRGFVPIGDYLINDEFSSDLAVGALNGTPAEPGPGVRQVDDPNSFLSLSGGALVIASGSGAWASGVSWGASSVSRGRMLVVGYSRTAGIIALGWVTDPTNQSDLGYITVRTAVRVKGSAGDMDLTGTLTSADVAVIHRDPGYAILVKIASHWRLAYMGVDGLTSAANYAIVRNYNGVMTVGYFRVPSQRWLPAPLVSDGFSSALSDGLGHAEGVSGGLGSGGGGNAWTVALGTWTVTGGMAAATALSGGVAIETAASAADVLASVKVYWTAGKAGLVLRCGGTTNYIYVVHTGTHVQVYKRISNIETSLQDIATTYVAGSVLMVMAEGSSFRIYYNDALVVTLTIADATVQSSTVSGLYTTDTGNIFDDFAAYARGSGGEYDNILDAI